MVIKIILYTQKSASKVIGKREKERERRIKSFVIAHMNLCTMIYALSNITFNSFCCVQLSGKISNIIASCMVVKSVANIVAVQCQFNLIYHFECDKSCEWEKWVQVKWNSLTVDKLCENTHAHVHALKLNLYFHRIFSKIHEIFLCVGQDDWAY
jgi:hypothetical protein